MKALVIRIIGCRKVNVLCAAETEALHWRHRHILRISRLLYSLTIHELLSMPSRSGFGLDT